MLEISRTEKLALGILTLNYYNQRRYMTIGEYEIFSNYLHAHFDFVDGWFNAEEKENLAKYFDEIYVNKELIYRLKPEVDFKDLRKYVSYFPVKFLKVVNEAVLQLKAKAQEEEPVREFTIVDEKAQLETLYELAQLEKQKRKLEAKLNRIRDNSLTWVDLDLAKTILAREIIDKEDYQNIYNSYIKK